MVAWAVADNRMEGASLSEQSGGWRGKRGRARGIARETGTQAARRPRCRRRALELEHFRALVKSLAGRRVSVAGTGLPAGPFQDAVRDRDLRPARQGRHRDPTADREDPRPSVLPEQPRSKPARGGSTAGVPRQRPAHRCAAPAT